MSEKFKDHVTSIAFSLSLSGGMVRKLSIARHYETDGRMIPHGDRNATAAMGWDGDRSAEALVRRGLLEVDISPKHEGIGLYRTTEAGRYVCELLKIAGLYLIPSTERGEDDAQRIL